MRNFTRSLNCCHRYADKTFCNLDMNYAGMQPPGGPKERDDIDSVSANDIQPQTVDKSCRVFLSEVLMGVGTIEHGTQNLLDKLNRGGHD
jgi:hypothetical protein